MEFILNSSISMHIVRAELLTFRKEPGGYVMYVFRNLDSEDWDSMYIMTVRFPNWHSPSLQVGDKGYLKYKEVEAGKSTWWDNNSQTNIPYSYDNVIFEDFIHDRKKDLTVLL